MDYLLNYITFYYFTVNFLTKKIAISYKLMTVLKSFI